jgi:hypothetical protein
MIACDLARKHVVHQQAYCESISIVQDQGTLIHESLMPTRLQFTVLHVWCGAVDCYSARDKICRRIIVTIVSLPNTCPSEGIADRGETVGNHDPTYKRHLL